MTRAASSTATEALHATIRTLHRREMINVSRVLSVTQEGCASDPPELHQSVDLAQLGEPGGRQGEQTTAMITDTPTRRVTITMTNLVTAKFCRTRALCEFVARLLQRRSQVCLIGK